MLLTTTVCLKKKKKGKTCRKKEFLEECFNRCELLQPLPSAQQYYTIREGRIFPRNDIQY